MYSLFIPIRLSSLYFVVVSLIQREILIFLEIWWMFRLSQKFLVNFCIAYSHLKNSRKVSTQRFSNYEKWFSWIELSLACPLVELSKITVTLCIHLWSWNFSWNMEGEGIDQKLGIPCLTWCTNRGILSGRNIAQCLHWEDHAYIGEKSYGVSLWSYYKFFMILRWPELEFSK